MNTLVDVLINRSEATPDQMIYTYLSNGEDPLESYSYRELDTRARTIAQALQKTCVMGDRALLLYSPGLDFIAAFFGCLYAGVLAVPAYPPDFQRLNKSMPRLLSILHDATPSVILTVNNILMAAQHLGASIATIREIPWLATDTLSSDGAKDWQDIKISPEHLAFLQYTSGSTATPKGVMLSHENIMYNQRMITHAFSHTADATIISWLPQYHDMGLIGNLLQPLYVGSSCYFMSPHAFLRKPVRWLQAISRYRGHTTGAPNFAFDLCTKKVTEAEKSELDLSSLQTIYSGAEPVRHESLQRFIQTFAVCGLNPNIIFPVYGLAEATLFVTGGHKGKAYKTLMLDKQALAQHQVVITDAPSGQSVVSCGFSWLDQQLLIIRPEAQEICQADEIGEIWIRGNNVAQGYWQKDEINKATFQAYPSHSDRGLFFRTGDLGFLKDGELFVTGRIKDLIKIRGRSLYPQDLEGSIERLQEQFPEIRLGCVAAFAFSHEVQEQMAVMLEIDPDKNPGLDTDLLSQTISQTLLEEHGVTPQQIVFIAAGHLPKTSSGKIMRHACQKLIQNDALVQQIKLLQRYERPEGFFYMRRSSSQQSMITSKEENN